MSPRPRKASNEDVFAAAARAMSRLGPSELTLDDIAKEAGLTAGALVQRFGSKRELFVTLVRALAASTSEMFAGLLAASPSPLAALYAYGECMAQMAATPATLTRSLAWLLDDLNDAERRVHLVAHSQATRRELRRIAEGAIAAGELRPSTNAAVVARAIETTVGGSMLTWAFHEEGSATAWIRHDVAVTLEPWLTTRGRKRAGSAAAARRARAGRSRP